MHSTLFAVLQAVAAAPVAETGMDSVRVVLEVELSREEVAVGPNLKGSGARVRLHRLAHETLPASRYGIVHQQQPAMAIPDPAWQSEALDPEPIAEGPIDGEGIARIEVPWASVPPQMIAIVDGPGLCATPTFPTLRFDEESGAYTGSVVARSGRTVRGRVVDALGRSVAARIEMATDLTPLQSLQPPRRSRPARSYRDGTFEIDLEVAMLEGSSTLDLFADAGKLGTGAWPDVQIATLLDAKEPLVLSVGGTGVLRGRVVDNDGHPASDVWVCALAEGVEAREALTAADDGAVLRRFRTDPDGTFELRGLASRPFRIAADLGFAAGEEASLGDGPAPADGEPVELVLVRDELIVRTSSGEALQAIARRSREDWPRERSVLCWPALDSPSMEPPFAPGLTPRPLEGGARLPLNSASPRRLAVILVGGQGPVQHRTIDLRPGRQEVVFDDPPNAAFGTVEFEVRVPGTGPERGQSLLQIEPSDLPYPILRRRFTAFDSGRYRARLPVGCYRAVLSGATPLGGHGEVIGSRRYGRTEVEFEVFEGTNREVLLEARRGGRIEVTTRGRIERGDREAVLAQARPMPWLLGSYANLEALVTLRAGQVSLALHSPDRAPEPLEFLVDATPFGYGGGVQPWPQTTLGTTATAEVVPSGDYELVATLPGGRTWRGSVQVREGATTSVVVSL